MNENTGKAPEMKKSLLTAHPRPVAGPHPHHKTAFAPHSKAMKYGAMRFALSRTSFLKIAQNGAGRILTQLPRLTRSK